MAWPMYRLALRTKRGLRDQEGVVSRNGKNRTRRSFRCQDEAYPNLASGVIGQYKGVSARVTPEMVMKRDAAKGCRAEGEHPIHRNDLPRIYSWDAGAGPAEEPPEARYLDRLETA
jgi:hypothetical protein